MTVLSILAMKGKKYKETDGVVLSSLWRILADQERATCFCHLDRRLCAGSDLRYYPVVEQRIVGQ